MAWRPPEPNLDGAAKAAAPGETNIHLLQVLQQIRSELKLHRQKLGQEAIDLRQRSSTAPAPPLAAIAVNTQPVAGHFHLLITNPEFVNPRGASQNQQKTPLYHQVEYATDAAFTEPTTLPPGHQTYYLLTLPPGKALHARVKSSYDGIRWNRTQIVRSR